MSDTVGPGGDGYTEKFYTAIAGGSARSAEVVLPLVFAIRQPRTIIDVGCGVGAWLRVGTALGAEEVLGLDGDHVPHDLLEIDHDSFHAADLSKPLSKLERKFDLAMSLEVAEHLPPGRADSFVADLCALSDVVLFSAAIPNQGGQDHVNEQWQSEWAGRFAANGFSAFDLVRPAVWGHADVEYWYQQNTIVYVARARQDLIDTAKACMASTVGLWDVVHPTTLAHAARTGRFEPGLRYSLALTGRAARRAISSRLKAKTRRG